MIELDRAILDVLDRNGDLHVRDISAEVDEHPVTVDQRCFSLHQRSFIRTLGTGVYGLTPTGERRLTEADVSSTPEPSAGGSE